MGAEKIAFLRTALAGTGPEGHARVALGHAQADACLLGGIRNGALHEVFPAASGDEAAASGFVTALAARVGARVLWCGTDFAALEHGGISATGLVELGLDPGRFLLLRAPDATAVLRGGLDALSCASLGAVVLEIPGTPKILDLSASRRLVLAAARSGVTAMLLRLDAQAEPSAAKTRWLVRAARSHAPSGASRHPPHASAFALRASADKSHGGGKDDWGIPRFEAELVRHRHGRLGQWVMEWNCDDRTFAADSGAVVSAASDRPAATQIARVA
jgi:protein ImuA